MSRSLDIFLHTNLSLSQTAERIAGALGAKLMRNEVGREIFFRPVRDGGPDDWAVGEIRVNNFSPYDPDEPSVIDGYQIYFGIDCAIRDESMSWEARWETRWLEAERFFTDITERLGWPALLVDNLDMLVAAWSPEHGRTDFPTGTTPDFEHQSLWSRYVMKR
jgi:hypothetical protein